MKIRSNSLWITPPRKYRVDGAWIIPRVYRRVSGAWVDVTPTPGTEQHVELFLDEVNIQSHSGVTFAVNRPTKQTTSVATTIFPLHDDVDVPLTTVGIAGASIRYTPELQNKIAVTYRSNSQWDVALLYADAFDRTSYIAPSLGLVTHDGDTDNNFAIAGKHQDAIWNYFPENALDQKYIMALRHKDWTDPFTRTARQSDDIQIWKSSDFVNWTFVKQAATWDQITGSNLEPKSIAKRSDGKYVVYYSFGHSTGNRQIAAFMSDTTDIAGDWTDQGVVVASGDPASQNQRYDCSTIRIIPGLYLHVVATYNSTTGYMRYLRLYLSRDCLTFTLLDTAWIQSELTADYDGGMILRCNMIEGVTDNVMDIAYESWNGDHDNKNITRTAVYLAHATIPYRRIGQISATTEATVVTDELIAADELMINCNATGGSVQVELLDPSDDSVLSGYAKADSDVISSNVFKHVVRWGKKHLPANQNFKVKLYITDATVYSLTTGVY